MLYGTFISIFLLSGHFGHGFADGLGGQDEIGGHDGHVGAFVGGLGMLVVHCGHGGNFGQDLGVGVVTIGHDGHD